MICVLIIVPFLALYLVGKKIKFDGLLFALPTWCATLYIITESLSFFNYFSRIPLIIVWGLISCISLLWIHREIRLSSLFFKCKIPIEYNFSRYDILKFVIGIFCFVLSVIALKIAPNNWDSMTYHMSRVANWIQNKTVDYYPTNIIRQLVSPVLSEYIIAHLYILLHKDIASNLVQWGAYVVNIFIIFKILTLLNIGKLFSYISIILYITMPMAIAQSVTTQTDLIATVFLLSFLYYLIIVVKKEHLTFKDDWLKVGLCALSIVLGYLTKSSVCIGMLVFLIYMAVIRIYKKDKFSDLLLFLLSSSFIIISLAFPIFIRNYYLSGNIFALDYMGTISIGTVSPLYVFINVLKNWSLLTASPLTAHFLYILCTHSAKLFNIDINDKAISFTNNFSLPVSSHHDAASCYIVSSIFTIIFFIWLYSAISRKIVKDFGIQITISLSILVALIVIKYQPWGSRLLLPYSTLMCLFVGIALNNFFTARANHTKNYKNIVIFGIITIALVGAVHPLLYQSVYFFKNIQAKDNRLSMYFLNRDLYKNYSELSNYVDLIGCKKIGLFVGGDSYEYPLWVRLKNRNTELIQVVPNMFIKLQHSVPECILDIQHGHSYTYTLKYLGKEYVPIHYYNGDPNYALLAPQSDSRFTKETNLTLKNTISFSNNSNSKSNYLIKGFDYQNEFGIWMTKNSSELTIQNNIRNNNIYIRIGFIANSAPVEINIYANNKLIKKQIIKEKVSYSWLNLNDIQELITFRFVSKHRTDKSINYQNDNYNKNIAISDISFFVD